MFYVGPITLILKFYRYRPSDDNYVKIRSLFSVIYHDLKIGNYGLFQIWDLSIPSERAPSKLSEKSLKLNHQNSSYRLEPI